MRRNVIVIWCLSMGILAGGCSLLSGKAPGPAEKRMENATRNTGKVLQDVGAVTEPYLPGVGHLLGAVGLAVAGIADAVWQRNRFAKVVNVDRRAAPRVKRDERAVWTDARRTQERLKLSGAISGPKLAGETPLEKAA